MQLPRVKPRRGPLPPLGLFTHFVVPGWKKKGCENLSRIAYFDKELQQLPPRLPLCLLLLLLPLLHMPRSCPLAFHTFAYHLRGRLGEGVGWQQGEGCCCCLSQPTLARVFLATCSSSSRSRSRSRFRCQGTTRLLEEVATCRSRRRGRGTRGGVAKGS